MDHWPILFVAVPADSAEEISASNHRGCGCHFVSAQSFHLNQFLTVLITQRKML